MSERRKKDVKNLTLQNNVRNSHSIAVRISDFLTKLQNVRNRLIINHLLSNEELIHKVVDNEDMEELKKVVIEKKSIQKKSSYTYVCTNIFFHEG